MHHNVWIYSWHLFICPSEKVTKFLKKVIISLILIGGKRCANVDIFNYSMFDRNIKGYGLLNIFQFILAIHLMNKDRTQKWLSNVGWTILFKIVLSNFRKWGSMMIIVPWGFIWNHDLHDAFVNGKYVVKGIRMWT